MAWLTSTEISIVFTLILLEAVLSFDNAAMLAALSRRLPVADRARALNIGLLLAYALRLGAIGLAWFLVRHPILAALGGAYLVYIFVKHFADLARGRLHGEGPKREPLLQRLGMTAFAATIVTIGVIDLAFAIDQVIAAVGFTKRLSLIIVAATVGLLALRLLAPIIARVMEWQPLLEHVAFIAVGFVGGILILEYLEGLGWHHLHLSPLVKVTVTVGLFALPVLLRLLRPRNHEERGPA